MERKAITGVPEYPSFTGITPAHAAERLRFVRDTKQLLETLIEKSRYVGDSCYSDSVQSRIAKIDKFDGVIAEELRNWLSCIETTYQLFILHYGYEIEFLNKYH